MCFLFFFLCSSDVQLCLQLITRGLGLSKVTAVTWHQENKKAMLTQETDLPLYSHYKSKSLHVKAVLVHLTWLPQSTEYRCSGNMRINRISLIFTNLYKLFQHQLYQAITPTCPSGNNFHQKASVKNKTELEYRLSSQICLNDAFRVL